MKIIFWGTPEYAAENLKYIVNSGFDVVAVVTQPDRKRGRGKKLSPSPVKLAALDFGIPVLTSQSIRKDKNTKDKLINFKADVFLVVAFGQILPKDILDLPKLGCWNSHASLLPVWRGAAPIQWSIINDDAKTGICIMYMEEGLDTGPIVEQETTDIDDSDNLVILTKRLSKISGKLLVKLLRKFELNNSLTIKSLLEELKATNQEKLEGKPSYARQIHKQDYLIDWDNKARTIIKKIQGLYPNAYTTNNGKRIKISEACALFNEEQFKGSKKITSQSMKPKIPGEIILINKQEGIMVMTNDYPIQIKYAQLEGKKLTDSYTLSIQADLSINTILGN